MEEKAKGIVVEHNPNRPLTIGEAYNKLEDDKANMRSKAKERISKLKIGITAEEDQLKYLFYCTTFLPNKKEQHWIRNFIMGCRTYDKLGKSKEDFYRDIAIQIYKAPTLENINMVKTTEKKIFDKLKNKVEQLNASGIPLVGGVC